MSFFQQVRAYQTPKGKVDVPYAYVFDATGLTDGNSYQRLSVPIDYNSEFILRRVSGLDLCVNSNATGKFLCRDSNARQLQQNPIRPGVIIDGATVSGILPILPEIAYPPSSQINFDLLGVLRSVTADVVPIYNSYLAFVGVRRFPADGIYTHETKYSYHELPYTYPFALTLNWSHWTDAASGIPTNPRVFSVPIFSDDFELSAIGVSNADGTPVTTNDFQLSIWDASRSQLFSSIPLNLPYVNYNGPKQYGRPVFPVPSIVYPIRGSIQFSIRSMLPFGVNRNYVIHFMGIKRRENK